MSTKNEVATQKTFSVALTEKLDSVSEALPKDFNKARFVQNALALFPPFLVNLTIYRSSRNEFCTTHSKVMFSICFIFIIPPQLSVPYHQTLST